MTHLSFAPLAAMASKHRHEVIECRRGDLCVCALLDEDGAQLRERVVPVRADRGTRAASLMSADGGDAAVSGVRR